MTSRSGRTCAYWLYDARDALLYVGVASDPRSRWKQHAASKAWWPDVRTKVIEWFDDLDEARSVEATSIREDLPIHNRLGSTSSTGPIDSIVSVNLMKAKDRLHELVDQVAQGGAPVAIARRGKPLAVLVSYHELKAGWLQ